MSQLKMSKKKYYTVWKGHKTGVFDSWEECKKHIAGFTGAKFKSFFNLQEALEAFKLTHEEYTTQAEKKAEQNLDLLKQKIGLPNYNSIAVDAAVSGNPGKMEYRGVDTKTKKQLFTQGPFEKGTNNIGEFLAIVHGLSFLKKQNSNRIMYTDSKTAISWVKKKNCNTKLKRTEKNKPLFELVDRAENWLKTNTYSTVIVKWETKAWGEIPADFGRK